MHAILLDGPALDGFGQMALDEALLESAPKDALILRLYRWCGQAVTFGYFQPYEEVLRKITGISTGGFTLVRRMTGGGLVYHDGDVTFSLIFPWDRLIDASWVYKEVHRGVHLGLKARNLKSRLWSPPESQRGNVPLAACFAGPSPMDLVHEDGKKCLGGALRRRRGMGLYQGSMRPEGFGATPERLSESIVDGIGQTWKTEFKPEMSGTELLKEARRLVDRKYRTDDWNKRR